MLPWAHLTQWFTLTAVDGMGLKLPALALVAGHHGVLQQHLPVVYSELQLTQQTPLGSPLQHIGAPVCLHLCALYIHTHTHTAPLSFVADRAVWCGVMSIPAQAVGQLTYIRPYVTDFSPEWLFGSSLSLVAGALALIYVAGE